MQLVQTAAEPPNQGTISLAMSGWTWKRRKALRRMVTAKKSGETLLVGGEASDAFSDDEGVDVVGAFIGFHRF
jgi:hypothetical protein